MRSSPRSLGNPYENMPRASDSGDPGSTSHCRSSECCLPPGKERRHRNEEDFGAETSRPTSLLCTLRTHQSPGEWQHSLPARLLALAGRDSHPLDFIKWFPLPPYWFLHSHTFPSTIVVQFEIHRGSNRFRPVGNCPHG